MIRVLVAEDMHMIRGALVALLAREADIKIVAEDFASQSSPLETATTESK